MRSINLKITSEDIEGYIKKLGNPSYRCPIERALDRRFEGNDYSVGTVAIYSNLNKARLSQRARKFISDVDSLKTAPATTLRITLPE